MQVTAEVVRAEPAWEGLEAAQAAARTLATAPAYHVIELGLSSIVVDAPTTSIDPRPVSLVIQYLRN
jgi:hypothetical protein